jgi:hypothetical protein
MDKPESSCAILSKLNLYDVEKVVKEAYHHKDDPGRPPRKPMGIFKALMVKRLQQIPSERELCRRLWKDDNLRELCDIESEQNPYHACIEKRGLRGRRRQVLRDLRIEAVFHCILTISHFLFLNSLQSSMSQTYSNPLSMSCFASSSFLAVAA